MKASKIIDQLIVGDAVLIKGMVAEKDRGGIMPLEVKISDDFVWIDEDAEILLEQPKITHEQAWNKIAEAYPVSPQTLRNKLDNAVFGCKNKVTVKRFVAEWFEENKDNLEFRIWQYIRDWDSHTNDNFCHFMDGLGNGSHPVETLIRMKDGYEVEEPMYIVKLPTLNWNDEASELEEDFAYLILDITSDETRLSGSDSDFKNWRARLTELEIKSIDERYWPFAVPVDGSVEEID